MAETQAQSKLGELFVDIGVGGLGKTLKALNSVSASFLLTKNAAAQVISPIVNMSKQGASLATALSKINAETGIAKTTLLAFKRIEDLNSIAANTLSDTLGNLQQKILGAKTGFDSASVQAFQLMNLNPFELSEKDPVKAFDEIKNRIETLSPEVQTMALNLLGMNKELTYVYKNIPGTLQELVDKTKKQYEISEKQVENLEQQQKRYNEVKVATEQIGLNIASWKGTLAIVNELARITKDIATKGFKETIFDKEGIKRDIEDIQNNPFKYLPKSLRYSKFVMEQEDKFLEKKINKNNKEVPIIIGGGEVLDVSKLDNSYKTSQNNAILGATPITPGGNLENGTIPTLPNAAATTTNNNTSTVNINNYWNNQFDWIKEPEDMIQAADTLANQISLAEYTNTSNI